MAKVKKKAAKAKKSAQPDKYSEIEVELSLTDAEKAARGMAAGAKSEEFDRIESEFNTLKKNYSARLRTLGAEIKTLLIECHGGMETKVIRAKEKRNFATQRVEFWYKGKLVKTRDMTFADKQDELFPLADAKPGKVLKKREVGSNGIDLETAGRGRKQPIDESIAGAIKEQTSRRTAHTATDGVSGNAISAQ